MEGGGGNRIQPGGRSLETAGLKEENEPVAFLSRWGAGWVGEAWQTHPAWKRRHKVGIYLLQVDYFLAFSPRIT